MATETNTDTLGGLEERIVKAVQTVSRLKAERDAALKDLGDAKAEVEMVNEELENLRNERTQVRSRIEKLLGQLDQLSL